MASAIVELVIFSLPSWLWMRKLHRAGWPCSQALRAAGLQRGPRSDYLLAAALAIPVTGLAALVLTTIPAHLLHGSSRNITGSPTNAGDYGAIVILAVAEEMLFRGFVASLLLKRLGFRRGNLLQALIFFAPHTLLLLVSVSLWPLLPLQLIAGWILGWLRHRAGSIGPPALTHALTNLLPALLFGL